MHSPRVVIIAVLTLTTVNATNSKILADDLKQPQTVHSVNGVCDVVLEAIVGKNAFPAAGMDNWSLQSTTYVLRGANNEILNIGGLVGPIIRVGKGDKLRIRIINSLDPKELPKDNETRENYPQGYSVTNLHTHGLHVSPSKAADNIYVEIMPHEQHQFEYEIPANHPAGTYWYHPHKHGSVALQLTGGMAGALIVEGDLDHVPGIKGITEQVLVLQQFHGKILDAQAKLLRADPSDIYDKLKEETALQAKMQAPARSWRFMSGIQRKQVLATQKKMANPPLKPFAPMQLCQIPQNFPDPKQPADIEWLLVNGQFVPNIRIRQGEIQLWRFIHAGLDEVINLAVVDPATNGFLTLNEIAVDGLPRGRLIPRNSNLVYPAYRWDALFQSPDFNLKDGEERCLYLVDAGATQQETLNNVPGGTTCTVIAKIVVSGRTKDVMKLPTDIDLANSVPPELRGLISDQEIENRRWNLKFDFPDHGEATPAQFLINGRQYSARIDRFVRLNTAEEWRLESGTGDNNAAGHPFHVHVNPFQQLVYESVLTLQFTPAATDPSSKFPSLSTKIKDITFGDQSGMAQTISIGSQINFTGTNPWTGKPFATDLITVAAETTLGQLIESLRGQFLFLNKSLDQTGKNLGSLQVAVNLANGRVIVRVINGPDGALDLLNLQFAVGGANPGYFYFEKNRALVDYVWRDTLMAPSGRSEVVRMRFRDWPGDTVLHCHIVDHEDQGMMKNIRILCPNDPIPPDGAVVNVHGNRRNLLPGPAMAPDFSLTNASGKLNALRDIAGKKVLIFFRGAECLACNEQLQEVEKFAKKFQDAGVTIIAVSSTTRNGIKADKMAPARKQGLPFVLLADPEHETFKSYGCLGEQDNAPLHGTFVIDAKGVITWREVADKPYMDIKKVLERCGR
ncbi:MAG TPA: redoxin domain-containing protein [Gemmata sp.]|nr:redoxin domain-containing protein [Gemmata sp.]